MRSLSIPLLTVVMLAVSVDLTTGCNSESPAEGEIRAFSSDDQLDAYLAKIEAENTSSSGCGSSSSDSVMASESAGSSQASGETNAEITNNQESGVDEGGIVKNVGSSLVVLRKGRLFVAEVGEDRAPALTDSMRVARTEGLNANVWYDEMLVKGDLVYVVGYRYGNGLQGDAVMGATEVDSFRLANGKLTRLKSMFLESNDYYSGRDYASRMVGGKLVFYMPHYGGRRDGALHFPRVLEGQDDGSLRALGPVLGARDVFVPLTRPRSTTLHTVVQCDLGGAGELACRGRAVVGDWWRAKYVSTDAVFLWASSHVYRFDLASLEITAHAVEGTPVDQFSFRQTADALLVATNPSYDAASKGTEPSLVRVPLAAFDRTGKQVAPGRIPLAAGGRIYRNRFVGDVLVAAMQDGVSGWRQSSPPPSTLVAIGPDGALRRAPEGMVARIEPLGEARALVAVQGERELTLRAIDVADLGRTLGSVRLDGIRQGESRSHGFFYKPGADASGTFGYAIVNDPSIGASSGWGNGISNLGFFDVSAAGALSSRGIIAAGSVTGTCETSCTDWYGNTRPVFLRDRTFALMGSELAEVSLEPTATKGATVTLDAR